MTTSVTQLVVFLEARPDRNVMFIQQSEFFRGRTSSFGRTFPTTCPGVAAPSALTHSIKDLVENKTDPPAARCLSARQTSTRFSYLPHPFVTIATGHRCRPVLINVHGTPLFNRSIVALGVQWIKVKDSRS
ncbi:uncharacterized protein NPIL_326551 [Nephila pilipes]|uniref:Uncharacterized protein n=1 Tax=Nephila pilipes TaxID=299642 RepID=A0A8X6TNB2_NEPPI|nr:uncharacterized protein NPIL_326551 [Nephila pilipes]